MKQNRTKGRTGILPVKSRAGRPCSPIRGTALLYVLGLMMVLSIGLSASWRYLISVSDQSAYNSHQAEARRLAESGAYAAIAALQNNPSLDAVALTPFADGAYSVEIGHSSQAMYTLHVTGHLGEAAPYITEYRLVVDVTDQFHILRWEKEMPL